MNLAIFDLDGTLTDTNEIDTNCFLAAWQEEFGIDCSELDWSSFEHVTDRAITNALVERHFAVGLWPEACDRARTRFTELLADEALGYPVAFRAVSGAVEAVSHLLASGWAVAVATGAWMDSARIKLQAAGFPVSLPLSTSDCCLRREDVVRHAIQMAEAAYGCRFHRTVLLGDAPWDVATAANLKLPFVAVASAERAADLRASGALYLLPDFSDSSALLDLLAKATPPAQVSKRAAG